MTTNDYSPVYEALEKLKKILEISYPLCKTQDSHTASQCSKINTLAFKAIKDIDEKFRLNDRKN